MDSESETEDEDEPEPASASSQPHQPAPGVSRASSKTVSTPLPTEDDGLSEWFKVEPKTPDLPEEYSETETESENDSENEDVQDAPEDVAAANAQDDDWLEVSQASGSDTREKESMDVVSIIFMPSYLCAHGSLSLGSRGQLLVRTSVKFD